MQSVPECHFLKYKQTLSHSGCQYLCHSPLPLPEYGYDPLFGRQGGFPLRVYNTVEIGRHEEGDCFIRRGGGEVSKFSLIITFRVNLPNCLASAQLFVLTHSVSLFLQGNSVSLSLSLLIPSQFFITFLCLSSLYVVSHSFSFLSLSTFIFVSSSPTVLSRTVYYLFSASSAFNIPALTHFKSERKMRPKAILPFSLFLFLFPSDVPFYLDDRYSYLLRPPLTGIIIG